MERFKIFFRPQVNNFVLFLVARVGSTYLTSLMRSHPQILALSEELRDLEEQGSEVQLSWSEKFLTPPLVGKHKARGFNVKLVHLCDPDRFARLLQEKDCKVIHMQRRNRVKAVISRINGKRLYNKTGMWGLFDESNRLPPLQVDLAQFEEFLKHREKMDFEMEAYVKNLGRPLLPLYYEDLLEDQDAFLDGLYEFLEVDPFRVEGETLKITSDNLREVVLNFDELRACYVGTQYEHMFDEVIT